MLSSCVSRPQVEPYLNADMRVWFYNPYSNNNEEVLLPRLGVRLKEVGFPDTTRVLIYTDVAMTSALRAQVQRALVNDYARYRDFGFYEEKK